MRILLLAALLFTTAAQAHHLDHKQAWEMRQQGEILSAHQLLDQATARYPQARLLEMKLKHKGERYFYKLQLLLHNGQVKKLYYDAQSGELVREQTNKD